jgi:hypothetical protein
MTIQDPISFELVQNVIHDWFANATGLQVVWQHQNAPAPENSYGSLSIISGPRQRGAVADMRTNHDSRREAGKEVELEVAMECSFVVSCQVYVKGSDGANPTCSALTYCTKALMALELPSFFEALDAANISVADTSAVKNLNALIGTEWESRAGLEITFNSMLALSEFVGYIERVHAVSTQLRIDGIFGLDVPS